jgi:hypothetical protein
MEPARTSARVVPATSGCYTGRVRAVVLILGTLSACSIDARDLAAFRQTASGPDKLRAVVRSVDRAPALRALAALQLLDLPRKDVDGRALLLEELNGLEARQRLLIVPAFKQGLVTRMRTTPGIAPAGEALRAKDAAVKLLPLLGESERTPLGAELLDWIAEDVPRRADAGEASLEAVAAMLGPRSASVLIGALRESHAAESVARIAALLHRHAAPEQRARAAERVIELEKAYRARAPAEGTSAAGLLAERELSRSFLPALGHFTDQPAARARLVQIARAEEISSTQRKQALELLRGRVGGAELSALLELAQRPAAPREVRLAAVARVGETHNRDALPGLLIVLANRDDAELRMHAGELVLEMGGADALASFFRSLPSAWDMPFEKREIDAYGAHLARLSGDPAVVQLLGNKLHTSFWYNKVLALRYFAQRAQAEDIWRIRQFVYDPQPVFGAGWPKGHTVGLEAESALAQASERLHAAGGKSVWTAPVTPPRARPGSTPPRALPQREAEAEPAVDEPSHQPPSAAEPDTATPNL